MNFFDDKSKKTNWYNRNYLFLGTVIVVCVNILLFALLGNDFSSGIGGEHIWYDQLDFSNLWRVFLNGFEHSNWQHVLLNMLCFFVCGLYIERKTGTINFLLLTAGMAFISGAFAAAGSCSIGFHGASGIVYMCYAFVIVDYLFSFNKRKRSKTNIIMGAIIIALIYLAMCFSGGTSGFSFELYPYDLMNNLAHYSGFFASLIVSLMIQIAQLTIIKNSAPLEYKPPKVNKKIYILPALLNIALITATCLLSLL